MFSAALRKMRSFSRRSRFEQAWFLPVWLLLGLSRLLILIVPFRNVAPHLGSHSGVFPWVPVVTAHQESRARAISRTVQMAAKYTPWVSNCFPQAIAARLLLGLYRIPYCLFFGVGRENDEGMLAHAWIISGRIRVCGGESFGRYTVVGCFASCKPI